MNWIEQSIKNVVDDSDNEEYFYVIESDIRQCYTEDQILVLEAPLGAKLSVGNKQSNKVHIVTHFSIIIMPGTN